MMAKVIVTSVCQHIISRIILRLAHEKKWRAEARHQIVSIAPVLEIGVKSNCVATSQRIVQL